MPARAERQAIEIEAEAQRKKVTIAAEARAEAVRKEASGQAEATEVTGRADAEKLADLLRVNLLPECIMMSEELRELRRILRYRNMIVRTASKMKNKISGLLMEVGAVYDKRKLHGKRCLPTSMQTTDAPLTVTSLVKK